jgi:hypothetical protein
MFRKLWQRRRLGLVPAIILVTACGGAPASPAPAASAAAAAVAPPTAVPTTSQGSSASRTSPTVAAVPPAPSAVPVILDGLDLPEAQITPKAAIQAVAAYSFAVTGGTVWIGSPDGLVRIDPDTNTATVVDPEPGATVVARGIYLWRAALHLDRVTRYAGYSGEVRSRVSIPGAYGISPSGPVWVAERFNGKIDRLDESTGRVLQTVVTGRSPDSGPSGILEVGRELWVAQVDDRNFARVDPLTGEILGHVDVGLRPCQQQGVAAGAIWLCQGSDDAEPTPTVRRLDAQTQEMGPAYITSAPVVSALMVNDLVWLPIGRRLIGMDPDSGVAMHALTVDGLHYQENVSLIVRASRSIWVATTAGRVLRFDPTDFH